MKPLMLIKVHQDTDVEEFDNMNKQFQYLSEDYEIIIYRSLDIKVYYPSKPISFYYQQLKIWLIRKITKKK